MKTFQERLAEYRKGFEPVLVRDWALSVLFPLAGLVAEIVTDWDTETGWAGLAAGVVVRLSTASVRSRTTSMKKLDAVGVDASVLDES